VALFTLGWDDQWVSSLGWLDMSVCLKTNLVRLELPWAANFQGGSKRLPPALFFFLRQGSRNHLVGHFLSTEENFDLFGWMTVYAGWMKYATQHLTHEWLLIVNSHWYFAIKCTISSVRESTTGEVLTMSG
jgi:hypothetical protein